MKTRVKRRASRDGFSLIEVMVAASVLLIVFLGTFGTLNRGFDMLDTARNTTIASQILQSEIEDIRLHNWARLPTSGSVALPTTFGDLSGRFAATRTVEDVADRAGTMKRITITITWTDYAGRSHSRSYQTLFGRYGLNDYFVTNRS